MNLLYFSLLFQLLLLSSPILLRFAFLPVMAFCVCAFAFAFPFSSLARVACAAPSVSELITGYTHSGETNFRHKDD